MNGLGFLIWKLSNMPAAGELIALLRKHKVKWVSIKLANGTLPYNQTGGNDAALKVYIELLQAAGIEVGGWHYSYALQPGPEGDRAMERIEKLALSHWLVDIEQEWQKAWGAAKDAKTYMSKLKVGGLQVGLCSYRYPNYFPSVPFAAFLNHEAMDINTPQVYWEGSHNPAKQLQDSMSQYAGISSRPFMPIGATYGHTQNDGSWWQPTEADLIEFVSWCKTNRVQAYGFYSLDWILQKGMYNWLTAISGVTDVPEPEPPEPEPGGVTKMRVIAKPWLNVRAGPGLTYADIGNLNTGAVIGVRNVAGPNAWVEFESGKFAMVANGATRYLEPID